MAVEITNVRVDNLPALRFIGKRCMCGPEGFVAQWGEWFENGWFVQLEKMGVAPENGDAALGVTQYDRYWIGLLFPADTPVPEGFAHMELPASRYAVFGLAGREPGALFGEEGAMLCCGEMEKRGWIPREGGWGVERYSISPALSGKKVNVLYEFLNSIEGE